MENDIERRVDLDTEIKASGCLSGATADQLAEYDRLNEEYLESRPTDAGGNEDCQADSSIPVG